MTVQLLIYCAAHAPAEVNYLCDSALWSALWFALGWVTCYCTTYLTGGRK